MGNERHDSSSGDLAGPYLPIQHEQFRLLKFVRVEDGQIECELRTFQFDAPPPYRALSYVWSKDKNSSITCNGCSFNISNDLKAALHKIYAFQQELTAFESDSSAQIDHVWIDALCINQNDAEERANQVVRMVDIYSNANQTLVWLGDENDNSAKVIKSMHAFVESVDEFADYISTQDLPGEFQHLHHTRDLDKFFHRSWFFRVWIIQEAVLAKDICLLCGDDNIKWETLTGFVALYQRVTSGTPYVLDDGPKSGTSILMSFDMMRAKGAPLEGWTIADVFNSSRANNCTEEVDRVWALIGLLPEDIRQQIRHEKMIDYSPEGRQAYWTAWVRFTRMILQFDPEVGFCFLCAVASVRKSKHLPSWCADWSSPASCLSLALHHGYSASVDPNSREAQQRLQKQKAQLREFTGDINQIRLQGFVVDVIGFSSGSGESLSANLRDAKDRHIASNILAWLSNCTPFVTRGTRPIQDSLLAAIRKAPDALWETLTGSHTRNRGSRTFDRSYFVAWIDCLSSLSNGNVPPMFDDPTAYEDLQNFHQRLWMTCRGRKFLATWGDRLGIADPAATTGDLICVVHGAASLFVLREKGDNDRYQLVGEAYLHGLMNGQAYHLPPDQRQEDQFFVIE